MVLPAITLYQPWATWIMREWKTIETRTHDRFRCLVDKTVLIHAGMKTDESAINNPYLIKEQLLHNPDEMVNGFILGSVYVYDFRKLFTAEDEFNSLIECKTKRYGLFLSDVKKFSNEIPCKGEMGIWYYDLDKNCKVNKSNLTQTQLFPL